MQHRTQRDKMSEEQLKSSTDFKYELFREAIRFYGVCLNFDIDEKKIERSQELQKVALAYAKIAPHIVFVAFANDKTFLEKRVLIDTACALEYTRAMEPDKEETAIKNLEIAALQYARKEKGEKDERQKDRVMSQKLQKVEKENETLSLPNS